MFYIHKTGPPAPADPLYSVHVTERKRWERGYSKHQAAVKGIKGMVDQTKPKSYDFRVIKVLENTRRFVESQKQAQIERENSKLGDRIHEINTGSRYRSLTKSMGSKGHLGSHSTDTLHSTLRRRIAEDVRKDNASMVKRLLHVKTSPDVRRVFQEKDFLLHKKYKVLLKKIRPLPLPKPIKKPSGERLPPVGGASKSGEKIPTVSVKADSVDGSWPLLDCFILQGPVDPNKKKTPNKLETRDILGDLPHDRQAGREKAESGSNTETSTPNTVNVLSCASGSRERLTINDVVKDALRDVVLASLENVARIEQSQAEMS
eukprot:GEMP01018481.1.p1 GENE.GEMP01018481.1~~GEMP01018481.1.p1  ORF type:complete len:318 (+),score=65.18 GEMP01018481.1:59-1012(+)